MREATAHSIAEGVKIHPAQVGEAIQKLVAEYREKVRTALLRARSMTDLRDQAKELVPTYDQFGMIVEESLTVEDPWRTRVAQMTTFKYISAYFEATDVVAFFDLLIRGDALGDRNQAVRSGALDVSALPSRHVESCTDCCA